MDQPTNLEITIKGDVEAVKNAAIAMQKSIKSTTRGFDENSFVVSAERDFETIMSDSIDIFGSWPFQRWCTLSWWHKHRPDCHRTASFYDRQ